MDGAEGEKETSEHSRGGEEAMEEMIEEVKESSRCTLAGRRTGAPPPRSGEPCDAPLL